MKHVLLTKQGSCSVDVPRRLRLAQYTVPGELVPGQTPNRRSSACRLHAGTDTAAEDGLARNPKDPAGIGTPPHSSASSGGKGERQEAEESFPVSDMRPSELEASACSSIGRGRRSSDVESMASEPSTKLAGGSSTSAAAEASAREGGGSSGSLAVGKPCRVGSNKTRSVEGSAATQDGEGNLDARTPEVVTAATDTERESFAPSYLEQILYQGVVMFVLTLFPGWNPNPEYLLREVDEDENDEEGRETDESA